jgi:PAS domain S-box-containing protein
MSILLIEDDPGIAFLIKECLDTEGYQVHWVQTFSDADEAIEKTTPSLLIVDYILTYGETAEEWLKERVAAEKIIPPFLVSTGQGDERVAVSMMKLGAKDYLIKDTLFIERLPNVVKRVCTEMDNELKLRQIEAALRKEEKKYRLLVEKSGIGVCMYNMDGKVLFMNQKAVDDLTADCVSLEGKYVTEMLDRELADNVLDRIYEVYSKNHSVEYTDSFRKGEETKWLLSNYCPVNDDAGSIIGVQVLHHDITDRMMAENQIRKISDFYQSVIENAPDGIVVISPSGNMIFASPSAMKMFSYSDKDLPQLQPMELTHDDDKFILQVTLSEIFKNPSFSPTLEYRFRSGLGEWIWIESHFSNMLDNENINGIVINFRNITERKKAEEQLRQKMDELIRFQKITVGRELSMIDLKREVNELLTSQGKLPKYSIVMAE